MTILPWTCQAWKKLDQTLSDELYSDGGQNQAHNTRDYVYAEDAKPVTQTLRHAKQPIDQKRTKENRSKKR